MSEKHVLNIQHFIHQRNENENNFEILSLQTQNGLY